MKNDDTEYSFQMIDSYKNASPRAPCPFHSL